MLIKSSLFWSSQKWKPFFIEISAPRRQLLGALILTWWHYSKIRTRWNNEPKTTRTKKTNQTSPGCDIKVNLIEDKSCIATVAGVNIDIFTKHPTTPNFPIHAWPHPTNERCHPTLLVHQVAILHKPLLTLYKKIVYRKALVSNCKKVLYFLTIQYMKLQKKVDF